MQLILANWVFAPETDDESVEYELALESIREQLKVIDRNHKERRSDIGWGASFPALLLDFGLLFSGMLLLSDKVASISKFAENVEKFLSWAKGRYHIRIDQDAANLKAIGQIYKNESNIDCLEIIHSQTVADQVNRFRDRSRLDYRPDALYISIFRINHDYDYLFAIRSNGVVEVCHKLGSMHWSAF